MFILERQRMHPYLWENIMGGFPSWNARNSKPMAKTILTSVRGAKLPPPSWLPCIFSSPTHHQPIRQGSQCGALLEDIKLLGPQMLPFPLHGHFNIFNEERETGSNVRAKYKWDHSKAWLPACSLGNNAVLESLSGLFEWKLKLK